MKAIAFIIPLALIVSGCETVTTKEKSAGVFEISSTVEPVSWVPHHEGAYIQLKAMAKKNCPNGWTVTHEETRIVSGKETIVQTIKCK